MSRRVSFRKKERPDGTRYTYPIIPTREGYIPRNLTVRRIPAGLYPRTDLERVMAHYGVDESTARELIRIYGIDKLLPTRGAAGKPNTEEDPWEIEQQKKEMKEELTAVEETEKEAGWASLFEEGGELSEEELEEELDDLIYDALNGEDRIIKAKAEAELLKKHPLIYKALGFGKVPPQEIQIKYESMTKEKGFREQLRADYEKALRRALSPEEVMKRHRREPGERYEFTRGGPQWGERDTQGLRDFIRGLREKFKRREVISPDAVIPPPRAGEIPRGRVDLIGEFPVEPELPVPSQIPRLPEPEEEELE